MFDIRADKIIHAKCMSCGIITVIKVKEDDYYEWEGGELIQRAFPYLSADERELLISQICGPCFDLNFEIYDE